MTKIKFDKNVALEDILETPDDSEIGYFLEVDLTYCQNIKEKGQNIFHLFQKTNFHLKINSQII